MNRLQFRIVFNRRRGQFMATETVRGQGKAKGGRRGRARGRIRAGAVQGMTGDDCAVASKPPLLIPVAAGLALAAVATVLIVSAGGAQAGTPLRGAASAVEPSLPSSVLPTAAPVGSSSRIVADPFVPGSQRPTVLAAANGTTLANIPNNRLSEVYSNKRYYQRNTPFRSNFIGCLRRYCGNLFASRKVANESSASVIGKVPI